MGKQEIVFSDIDGTLCFHEGLHDVKEIKRYADGIVEVLDSTTKKNHLAYDVSTSLYKAFLGAKTRELGRKIQEKKLFVYVTGARISTMLSRWQIMNFADILILENGGLILDSKFHIDKEWAEKLEPEKKYLTKVTKELISAGWNLDNKGRTAAIRVRKKDNYHRSGTEFEDLCESLYLPRQLKKTKNIGNLDIILQSAGKGNAIKYILEKYGFAQKESVGIGDDINDLDLLIQTSKKYVMNSAYPQVIEYAENNNWYISTKPHFEGINEIMNDILLN